MADLRYLSVGQSVGQENTATCRFKRSAMQTIGLYLMTARDGAGQRQSAWTAV
jgi:hypothetical protein